MVQMVTVGNLQLQPTEAAQGWDPPGIIDNPDVVVTTGDIIDLQDSDTPDADLSQSLVADGIAFYESLQSAYQCPLLVVPGVSDPAEAIKQSVDRIDDVWLLDDCRITTNDLSVDTTAEPFEFIGWTFKKYDGKNIIEYIDFDRFSAVFREPQMGHDELMTVCAQRIEECIADYILDKSTAAQLASKLMVSRPQRNQFITALEMLKINHQQLKSIITSASGIPILCTPNFPFTVNLNDVFSNKNILAGSIALKMVILATCVKLVVGGHSHPDESILVRKGRSLTHVASHPSSGVTGIDLTPGLPPKISQ